jgi:hypothetical protein
MNKMTQSLIVLSGVFSSEACRAQTSPGNYRPVVHCCRPAPRGLWSVYSSTPAEGMGRGVAAVIYAGGEAARNVSLAAINYEQARSQYLDNVAKATQIRWERKRLAESERAKDRAQALAARDRYLAAKKSGALPRLEPDQLDPNSGELFWPEALLDDEYFRCRQKLEKLFLLRTHASKPRHVSREIAAASQEMKSLLKTNIRELSPNEYIAARKFLDSLAYEGTLSEG